MSDQYCETCSSLSGCICNILLGPGLTSVSTPSPSTPPPQSQPLSTNSAQTPGHFTPAYPVQHLFNTPPPSQNLYPPPGVFDSSHSQFYTPHHTWHTAQYGYNGILPPGDAYWHSGHHPAGFPPHIDPQGSLAPPALSDATGTVLNVNSKRPADASKEKSKRTRKKARQGSAMMLSASEHPLVNPSPSRCTVAGPSAPVGPSAPIPSAPMLHFGSINHVIRSTRKASSETEASDVWYHVLYLKDTAQPVVAPTTQERLRCRPDTQIYLHVACRFCIEHGASWRTWNIKNGQTDTIRTHLRTHHEKEWSVSVVQNRLKGWEALGFKGSIPQGARDSIDPPEPFTQEGLERRIVQFIARGDHAMNIVEDPLFREIIKYASTSPKIIEEKNILHRTRASELTVQEYQKTMRIMREELKNAPGRISFTCDMWTSMILRSFLAVTLHYCTEDGETHEINVCSRLGAFRHVLGSHTGKNLAVHFITVLKELGILNRIGCITLDNASNCDTMMSDLAALLKAEGVPFDAEGNRLRCFPHVVNISVKHGLTALTKIDLSEPTPAEDCFGISSSGDPEGETDPNLDKPDLDLTPESNIFLQNNPAYTEALQNDPIKRAQELVSVCRASGQRREELMQIIKDGNKTGAFPEQLPEVQLLRNVDTRWSSIYVMIHRLLELYPAIQVFLSRPSNRNLSHHLLTEAQLRVLRDIRNYLWVPHRVQELLSAEQHPTAAIVLPLYEHLLTQLKAVRTTHLPQLAHAIDASIAALEKYMAESRKTSVYALAMVINPTVKFKWLKEHWTPEEILSAEEIVTAAMLQYRQARREAELSSSSEQSSQQDNTLPNPGLSRSDSSGSLSSRMNESSRSCTTNHAAGLGLHTIAMLDRDFSLVFGTDPYSGGTSQPSGAAGTRTEHETEEEHAARLHAEDLAAVKAELDKYKQDPLAGADINLMVFWKENREEYPLLYRVALDILPVPASAVASERVFSSSKETDRLRRSRLSGAMMEVLQVIKYSLKQRLREGVGPRLLSKPEDLLQDDEISGFLPILPTTFDAHTDG